MLGVAGERCRFIEREIFNGLFVSAQARDIDTNSRQGFEAMDRALKARGAEVLVGDTLKRILVTVKAPSCEVGALFLLHFCW